MKKKSAVPRVGASSFEKALLKRPAAAARVLKRPSAAAQMLKRPAAAAPAASGRPSKARRTQEPQARSSLEGDALMEVQRAEEPEAKGRDELEARGDPDQEAKGSHEQEAACGEEPEVTGSAGNGETELTVFLASGSRLAVLRAGPAWTGADVKAALSAKLEAGTRLDALLSGSRAFEDQLTVRDFGLSGSAELQAVLGKAEPVLHLVEACSAVALASRHGCWSYGGGSDGEGSDAEETEDGSGDYGLCLRGVRHRALDTAPPAAREVAQELREALVADLRSAGRDDSEVIAISGAGSDAREACLRGLAIRREDRRFDREGNELGRPTPEGEGLDLWGATAAEGVDVSSEKAIRFFWHLAKIREVMGRRLTGHFLFRFSMDDESPKPIVLGGFASDGSIVGVLSSVTPY